MQTDELEGDLALFKEKTLYRTNTLKLRMDEKNMGDYSVLTLLFRREIKKGYTEFLRNFLRDAQVPKGKGVVILNGLGGDTVEALEIAILLREHFNEDLKVVVPRIAASALVYIALIANEIILQKENTYLTTVNSTLSKRKGGTSYRLIPGFLLGEDENSEYKIAKCDEKTLEINRVLEAENIPKDMIEKLKKIKDLLHSCMWKITEISTPSQGDLVTNLFLEQRNLEHEFLDFKELIKRKFPLNKKTHGKVFEKFLKEFYEISTTFMIERDIHYLIHCNTSVACKYY